MLFKFLQKPVVLDCFTYDPFAYEHAKIDFARKAIPDWWKELPNSESLENLKACKGFTDYYNSSIYLPSWTRIQFDVNTTEECNLTWNSTLPIDMQSHNPKQFNGFVGREYQVLKMLIPWYFKTKEDIKFLISDPVWNRNGVDNLITLPGILTFKDQFEVNYNFMIRYLNVKRIINIMVGDPLVMLTPVTDRKIIIKTHFVEERDRKKFMITDRMFFPSDIGKFNKIKLKKDFLAKSKETNSEAKCPFGFGRK